jgi:EKC/KEOPS complex subunit CGI121/TPRKB
MRAIVEGAQVPLSELASLTDWAAVKKVGVNLCASPIGTHLTRRQYNKLNGDLVIRETQNDPTREHHLIDNIVVSLVAMKSVAA